MVQPTTHSISDSGEEFENVVPDSDADSSGPDHPGPSRVACALDAPAGRLPIGATLEDYQKV